MRITLQNARLIPHGGLRIVFLILILVLEVLPMTNAKADVPENQSKAPESFLVELKGTRPGWPDSMTADEERVLGEHFVYLKDLTAKGKCLVAGPVWGKFGLVILRVASETEAREIMDKEPSVVQKVHTYELFPMVVALQAERVGRERYPLQISDRVMYKEVEVAAPLAEVWRAWTTDEGAREFFAENSKIELRTGGPYEIYFDTTAAPGMQGGEGNRVLSFLPMSMFSFEWNAPPKFGPLRDIRTRVVINFEPVSSKSTKVKFSHLGWGTDPAWNEIYDYFDNAWSYVLGNLKLRFETGPIK